MIGSTFRVVFVAHVALVRGQCGPGASMPYPPGQNTCPTGPGQGMSPHSGSTQQGSAPPQNTQGMPTQPMTQTNMGTGGASISCTVRPCAASSLGDVGLTTAAGTDTRTGASFVAGENIYGPFEAGFGSQQNSILEGLGCSTGTLGHVDGGLDTFTAEQMVAYQCGITLPRIDSGNYISLIDECGGHTNEYHFHEKLACLYDQSASGHSAQVGQEVAGLPDGIRYKLYGKYENRPTTPQVDACNGHFGVTPDSAGEIVYHYHVTDSAPFTIGCHGPDTDGGGDQILVTLERCRAVTSGCSSTATSLTRNKGNSALGGASGSETIQYTKWCSCFDGAGSNTGSVTLPVFANGNIVKKTAAATVAPASAVGSSSVVTVAPALAVNCVGSWGAWGTCTAGVETRTYTITTVSANGGTPCPHSQGETETRPCGNSVTPPPQCSGTWTPVNGTTCSNGVTSKTYITSNATETANAACPANGTVTSTMCGTHCLGYWGGWGDCAQDSTMCYFQVTYTGTSPTAVTSKTSAQYHDLVYSGSTNVGWTAVLTAGTCPTSAAVADQAIKNGKTGMINANILGKRSRTFTVTQQEANNGRQCPELVAFAGGVENQACDYNVRSPPKPGAIAAPPAKTLVATEVASRLQARYSVPACWGETEFNANAGFTTANANALKLAAGAASAVVNQVKCRGSCGSGCSRRQLEDGKADSSLSAENDELTHDDSAEPRTLTATISAERDVDLDFTLTFATAADAQAAASSTMTSATFSSALKSNLDTQLSSVSAVSASAVQGVAAPQTSADNPTFSSARTRMLVQFTVVHVAVLGAAYIWRVGRAGGGVVI
ncbi:unnamed protein product [Amoebophrya sp. A25]|nr:unnamed protein product [Amoebophrya sp. A25]|eukprot:GSA25T00016198001.1